MKFKGGDGKGISISKDYLRDSYEKGHYVEAIILSHYVIGVVMNITFDRITQMLNLQAVVNRGIRAREVMPKKASMGKTLEKITESAVGRYRFVTVANILFDMGFYDNVLYGSLRELNKCRNKVAHRLFSNIPTQPELDKCFELGMRLWDDVDRVFRTQLKDYLKLATRPK